MNDLAGSLPIAGHELVAICFDSSIEMHFGEARQFTLRIEVDLILESRLAGQVSVHHSPYSSGSQDRIPEGVTRLVGLIHQRAERATASHDGSLHVEFENGDSLSVATGSGYEAWTLVGPSFFRVALPSGGLG
jgi:Family of unknown function (DUF6188)